ncbi:MAG TPA: hypothetical protein H9852_08995 [Candidatus Mediterraneibacter colneyensis]|nr:hypothetical protein [Candidatus Mediterraneibacter colneyensis]
MSRKLIIDGNAVYEIDEECMLKNRLDEEKRKDNVRRNQVSKNLNDRKKD